MNSRHSALVWLYSNKHQTFVNTQPDGRSWFSLFLNKNWNSLNVRFERGRVNPV